MFITEILKKNSAHASVYNLIRTDAIRCSFIAHYNIWVLDFSFGAQMRQ